MRKVDLYIYGKQTLLERHWLRQSTLVIQCKQAIADIIDRTDSLPIQFYLKMSNQNEGPLGVKNLHVVRFF
jgi:hypothetical protein